MEKNQNFNFGDDFAFNHRAIDATTHFPKLPDFARADPQLWFVQIEFMLNSSRITSQRQKQTQWFRFWILSLFKLLTILFRLHNSQITYTM